MLFAEADISVFQALFFSQTLFHAQANVATSQARFQALFHPEANLVTLQAKQHAKADVAAFSVSDPVVTSVFFLFYDWFSVFLGYLNLCVS